MTWFIVALGAPFVWSLVNHFDKIILSKYFKGDGSGGLMIFVGVVSIPLSLLMLIFVPGIFEVSSEHSLYLIISGILYNITVFFYLKALEKEDTSYIVPFWQLAPIFAYFLGILLLGEAISTKAIIGGIITIIGTLILTVEVEEDSISRFKWNILGLMIVSSIVAAFSDVLFKKSAIDDLPFFVSMFWNQIGMAIFGIAFYFNSQFRLEFHQAIKLNSGRILSLNIGEQLMEIVGVFINNYALLLAPVALVTLVSFTTQPVFVFIIGILGTLLIPSIIKEKISHRHLLQRILAMIIMGSGLYLVVGL